MTHNLTVHRAKYQSVCGEIEFTHEPTRKRYWLRFDSTDGLAMADVPRRAEGGGAPPEFRKVARDDVIAILNESEFGSFSDWDWRSFMAAWAAWSDGYLEGVEHERRERREDYRFQLD